MLRSFVQKCVRLQPALSHTVRRNISTTSVRLSHHQQETDEEFDKRYVDYLSNPNITGWEIRKAMNDLCGEDMVPDPKIMIAMMQACRRVNDYALAVRILESCKDKAGKAVDKIWPYMVQELTPTVKELGINFPEELGYDKPELACVDVEDIH